MNSTPRSTSPATWAQPSRSKPTRKASTVAPAKISRPKKVVQALDTNPSSYDRTDPFFAFNTLIKLLGSLPSRIGGCQYKLTPDEHKLSLHLLTIVEPFVGLAPSRRTITRQPTEVLDAIIFHVDARRDLLALALSCRRMHDVVCPRHLAYRVVRCKVSALSVWNHLVVHRALARNVRQLEILDERSTEPEIVPPGILVSDTDLESTDDELGMHDKQERYLVSALTKMTALASFKWACNHSPISIDNVWPTLLKCQSLQGVEINDNLVFSTPVDTEERKARKQVVLPQMTTLSMRSTSHIYGSTKQPNLQRISGILNHCPNLKSLAIAYNPSRSTPNTTSPRPPADDLLLYGRWTQLTSLTLTHVRCSPTTGLASTSAFLSAHPNLEVLHLDITGPTLFPSGSNTPSLVLPPGSLPRLRELHANKEIATAVLACPCPCPSLSSTHPHPRPLETLKGPRLSGRHSDLDLDRAFLASLKARGRSVRRIELGGWQEMEDLRRLVECAPGLTWLDVGKKGGGNGNGAHPGGRRDMKGGSAAAVTNTLEWATLLAELPELVAFHGVRFFFEVSGAAALPGVVATSTHVHISMADRSRIRKNDEVAAVLAWKCGKLRRVDHWEEGAGKVVVLVRDSPERMNEKEKVRWEVRRVKV
ncbi:hypothetical protein D9615_006233 [Tricholomella constricta]|uniref:F-box domain-containing protein n=1 Tax=Tricholomella constricta TaxID=117010 RepID=A0A8H5M4B1_9AGAR|nr:hypothetical protein D9615_006233 [Tricholomella constricta]